MTHNGTYSQPLSGTYGAPKGMCYGGESTPDSGSGSARAVTYGSPTGATYGGPLPGSYGPPTKGREPARRKGEYLLTLIDSDGERHVVENVHSMSGTRRRSAVNSLALSVPYSERELSEWRFSEAILTFDRRTLFRGELREVDPDETAPATDLTIYGPSFELEAGDLEVTYDGTRVPEAIRDFWGDYTEFTVTVTERQDADEVVIEEQTFTGTPLEILNELHEYGGYEWYVDVRRPDRAYSFPQARAIREPSIQVIGSGYQPSWDTTDYYNHVVVRGQEYDDGTTPMGEARDESEIERRGLHTWPEQTDLETDRACRDRAKTLLEEFLTNDEQSGSIEMVPRSIDPGTALVIDKWDDERRVGPHSLYFDGESSEAQLPADAFEDRHSGALLFWTKARFGAATHHPRIFNGQGVTFQMTDSRRLSMRIGNQSAVVSVDAYPSSKPPRDEWTFLHYDWEYDPSVDRTVVRAGHNGTIEDRGQFTGRFTPPAEGVILGRSGDSYFEGYLDDLRLYSSPQPVEWYEDLAAREEIPASDLLSRWPFNEGPLRQSNTLHDIVRGLHGRKDDTESRGTPLPVEQVQYSESMGEFQMSINLQKTESWALDLAKSRADIRTLKKYE